MAEAVIAVGTAVQAYGSYASAKASAKAEKLRERGMKLEAFRKRREIIREGLMAKATALSNATAQGAGEGSGLLGGQAQIEGNTRRGITAVNQDSTLSSGIFKQNAKIAWGGMVQDIGGGVASFGSSLPSMFPKK